MKYLITLSPSLLSNIFNYFSSTAFVFIYYKVTKFILWISALVSSSLPNCLLKIKFCENKMDLRKVPVIFESKFRATTNAEHAARNVDEVFNNYVANESTQRR